MPRGFRFLKLVIVSDSSKSIANSGTSKSVIDFGSTSLGFSFNINMRLGSKDKTHPPWEKNRDENKK